MAAMIVVALDGVALFVGFGIEGGWVSTSMTLGFAMLGLDAFSGMVQRIPHWRR